VRELLKDILDLALVDGAVSPSLETTHNHTCKEIESAADEDERGWLCATYIVRAPSAQEAAAAAPPPCRESNKAEHDASCGECERVRVYLVGYPVPVVAADDDRAYGCKNEPPSFSSE